MMPLIYPLFSGLFVKPQRIVSLFMMLLLSLTCKNLDTFGSRGPGAVYIVGEETSGRGERAFAVRSRGLQLYILIGRRVGGRVAIQHLLSIGRGATSP